VLKYLPIAACFVATAFVCAGADSAARMYEAGEKAARAGDSLKAYLLYAQAAKLDPGNALYTQRRAAAQGLASAVQETAASDPSPALDADRPEAAELLAEPVPALSPQPGRQTFDLRGEAGELFEKVAGAFGIRVLMDRDYRPATPQIRFQIEEATAAEALRVLETATDSFLTPLGETLALVARDTAQKRTELTPVTAIAVPIPERFSIQEGQELATAVQQTLEIKRVSLDSAKRTVYFRDTQQKALAARQMFADISRSRAQVEVDVELLSVSRTSTLSYGLSLPTSANLINFGGFLGNTATQPAAYLFGGGATLFGLGIASAAAFATLSTSSADTLLDAQVVALDGQAATLKVGQRYPVITSSYTAGVSGSAAQNPGLAPPIQFIDLGLTLKITPVVHEDSEVSLDVDAQFKTLGGSSVNSIPVIASQQYQGKVRLKDGEWAVIAGLVTVNDSETPTGVAGLASIPVFGRLFSHQTHEKDKSDVMIVLKPRLVYLPPWGTAPRPIWTGTETHPLTVF
jgi:general secretion pathway protein D